GTAETATVPRTVLSAPLSAAIGTQYRGPEGFFNARLTEAIRDLAEPIAVPGTGLPFLNSGSATRTRTIAMTARMPKTMRKLPHHGQPRPSWKAAAPAKITMNDDRKRRKRAATARPAPMPRFLAPAVASALASAISSSAIALESSLMPLISSLIDLSAMSAP